MDTSHRYILSSSLEMQNVTSNINFNAYIHILCIFQHTLVETEAENIRSKVKSAGPLMRNLMEEMNDTIQRLG